MGYSMGYSVGYSMGYSVGYSVGSAAVAGCQTGRAAHSALSPRRSRLRIRGVTEGSERLCAKSPLSPPLPPIPFIPPLLLIHMDAGRTLDGEPGLPVKVPHLIHLAEPSRADLLPAAELALLEGLEQPHGPGGTAAVPRHGQRRARTPPGPAQRSARAPAQVSQVCRGGDRAAVTSWDGPGAGFSTGVLSVPAQTSGAVPEFQLARGDAPVRSDGEGGESRARC